MLGRSDRITDQLAQLSHDSTFDPTDVTAELTELSSAIRETVRSFAGLHLTTLADGNPVTFTVFEAITEPAGLAASVRVPFPGHVDARTLRTVLRLFAQSPGAFVDLAADLTVALGLAPPVTGRPRLDPTVPGTGGGVVDGGGEDRDVDGSRIHLDADLPPWSTVTNVEGLEAFDTVNQAIGVLIEQGWSPEQAESELDRRAGRAGVGLHAQARMIIAGLADGAPDRD